MPAAVPVLVVSATGVYRRPNAGAVLDDIRAQGPERHSKSPAEKKQRAEAETGELCYFPAPGFKFIHSYLNIFYIEF
jgi:hypothetical protein